MNGNMSKKRFIFHPSPIDVYLMVPLTHGNEISTEALHPAKALWMINYI